MNRPFRGVFIAVIGCLTAMLTIGFSATSAVEVPDIQPQELKKMIESRADIVIVDAQVKGAFNAGHIPGSINLPWEEHFKSAGSLSRTKPVIIYCACGQDEKSTDMAGQFISRFGYKNVKVLKGGWYKWLELGYPQEKTIKKKL